MNDQELEQTVRATFATRAATVTRGPHWDSEVEVLDVRRGRRRPIRWRAPLAAAAAVLLVIGGAIVAGQQLGNGSHRTATQRPAAVIHRAGCPAGLPGSWQHAISSSTTSYGHLEVNVEGVTSDGTEIVTYSPVVGGRQGWSGISLGTLRPGQRTPHHLATFTRHTSDGVAFSIQVEGSTVLVGLSYGYGNGGINGVASEIALVNADTGARVILRNLPHRAEATADAAYLFDGAVYWDSYPSGYPKREVVHEYDVASGTNHVVYDGPYSETNMVRSAAGVWWSGSALHPDRPAVLPAPVAGHSATTGARRSLDTDGTAYAWASGRTIGWWAPGHDVVETTLGVATDYVDGVAGPLVFFNRNTDVRAVRVLDTRTGAVTVLQHTGMETTWHGTAFLGQRRKMISTSSTFTVTRLHGADLPPLTC